jgi:hypothetical protein
MIVSTPLKTFLKRNVEGYLFGDLRSMAVIKLSKGQRYGGVGYPMVMTALAGVELLGTLTSAKPFHRMKGDQRFRDFWIEYLYPQSNAETANLIYDWLRNGLAHHYMAKPTVVVTKCNHKWHLRRTTTGKNFYVDALTLAEDLERTYVRTVKPKITGAFKHQMATRFAEIRAAYSKDFTNKSQNFAKIPVGTRQSSSRVLASHSA